MPLESFFDLLPGRKSWNLSSIQLLWFSVQVFLCLFYLSCTCIAFIFRLVSASSINMKWLCNKADLGVLLLIKLFAISHPVLRFYYSLLILNSTFCLACCAGIVLFVLVGFYILPIRASLFKTQWLYMAILGVRMILSPRNNFLKIKVCSYESSQSIDCRLTCQLHSKFCNFSPTDLLSCTVC